MKTDPSLIPTVKCKSLSTVENIERADIFLIGIPHYLDGSRPIATVADILRILRDKAEENILGTEYIYSEDLKLYDLGDLIPQDMDMVLNDLKTLIDFVGVDKTRIYIGGDHTVTYPIVRVEKPDILIIFDAHLDMRDTYQFKKWSHATIMRRIHEDLGIPLFFYGVRGYSKEEYEYAVTTKNINIDPDGIPKKDRIHISIDIDVIDPSIIRQVQYPEPGGYTLKSLISKVNEIICQSRPKKITFDIVEYTPYSIDLTEISTLIKLIYAIAASTLYTKD